MQLLSPARNISAVLSQTLLFYTTLAASLPITTTSTTTTHRHVPSSSSSSSPPPPINKRADINIDSSAIGGIAGGVIGLILLSLVIGLGAASIAVLGSLEWREWRGKKDGDDQPRGEKKGLDLEGPPPPPVPTKDDTIDVEKAQPAGKPGGSRLTLKSFVPLDFRSAGWGKSNT